MCGIAGIYGSSDERLAARMIDVLAHRGPDDRGIWSDPDIPVTVGHCRLSIIDLSPEGHQPMSYADERLWITFNGEIYNFKELRSELEGLGCRFRSNSDTEVILAAYLKWGRDCVKRLRGMFAFALVDRRPPPGAPDLLLVRDRLGIKPLVYFEHGSRLFFASELRGLLKSGQVDRRIDPDALLDYLAVGSVFQPRTMLAGIKAISPGHWMEVSAHERRLVKYWDLHEATGRLREELMNMSLSEASERLRYLLLDAARYNMVADVPVGAFLSGGIDSTAVVGLMQEISGGRIRTFSVGFENAHSAFDERAYARIAADHLGCKHEEITVTVGEVAKDFPKVVQDLDQPSIDGTNTWIVSRAARRAVKVAVSGLGGDELFAGYPHFRWLAEDAHLCPKEFPVGIRMLEGLHRLRPNSKTLRLLFRFARPAERLSMLRRVLGNFEFKSAIRPDWREGFRERLVARHHAWLLADADDVQQTSYAEINGYLLSTLLRDVDVMSMAHGLEVRPMLLEYPLVEFAYSLPAEMKLKGSKTKYIFTKAAEKFLPSDVIGRNKMGFELPFIDWMVKDLQPYFHELLSGNYAKAIFRPSYLRNLQSALCRGDPPRALWAWGVLLAWIEANRIQLD
jgi:asparagine synthase (glutamine-hydrolysing)